VKPFPSPQHQTATKMQIRDAEKRAKEALRQASLAYRGLHRLKGDKTPLTGPPPQNVPTHCIVLSRRVVSDGLPTSEWRHVSREGEHMRAGALLRSLMLVIVTM
jgi:hypothetical protein